MLCVKEKDLKIYFMAYFAVNRNLEINRLIVVYHTLKRLHWHANKLIKTIRVNKKSVILLLQITNPSASYHD